MAKKRYFFPQFSECRNERKIPLFFLTIFNPSFSIKFSKANFNLSGLASSGSSSHIMLNLTSSLPAVLMMNSSFSSIVFAVLDPS